jgi:hypothetical protein
VSGLAVLVRELDELLNDELGVRLVLGRLL